MEESHPAVDVVTYGWGHNCVFHSDYRSYWYAETDVNIGCCEDFPGGGQGGGIADLAYRIDFEMDFLRRENGGISKH